MMIKKLVDSFIGIKMNANGGMKRKAVDITKNDNSTLNFRNKFMEQNFIMKNETSSSEIMVRQQNKSIDRRETKKIKIIHHKQHEIDAAQTLVELFEKNIEKSRHRHPRTKQLDCTYHRHHQQQQQKQQQKQPKIYRSATKKNCSANDKVQQKIVRHLLYDLREKLPQFAKEIPVNVPPGYYNDSNNNNISLLVGAERLKKSYFKAHTSDLFLSLFLSHLPKDDNMGIHHIQQQRKGGDNNAVAYVSTMASTRSHINKSETFLFVLVGKMDVFYTVEKPPSDVISSSSSIVTFPKERETPWQCITLESGDGLYIPKKWLYTMRSSAATITISFPIAKKSSPPRNLETKKKQQWQKTDEKFMLPQRTIEEEFLRRRKCSYPVSSKISVRLGSTTPPMKREGKKQLSRISLSSQHCTSLPCDTTTSIKKDSNQFVDTNSSDSICNVDMINKAKKDDEKKEEAGERKSTAGGKLSSKMNRLSLPFLHSETESTLSRNGTVHVTFGNEANRKSKRERTPVSGNTVKVNVTYGNCKDHLFATFHPNEKVVSSVDITASQQYNSTTKTRQKFKSSIAKKTNILSKKSKNGSLLHSMKSSTTVPDITMKRRPKRERLYCGTEGCKSTFSTVNDSTMWVMMLKLDRCTTATPLPLIPTDHPKHLICTKCCEAKGESYFEPIEILSDNEKKSIPSWEEYLYYRASRIDYDTAKKKNKNYI